MKPTLLLTLLFSAISAAHAFEGMVFEPQQDLSAESSWVLVCDNTGTCLAAGYQPPRKMRTQDLLPFSVLLTRTAGADAHVEGKVRLINDSEDPLPQNLILFLSNQETNEHPSAEYGQILPDSDGIAKLSRTQVDAILDTLRGENPRIEIGVKNNEAPRWSLDTSEEYQIVLKKMDAFQGRNGTPSALIDIGDSNKEIPAPNPKPVIKAAAVANGNEIVNPGDHDYVGLMALLTPFGTECAFHEEQEITLYPLNDKQLLAETHCWTGSLGGGNLYAIISADRKNLLKIVGENDSYFYANGVIEGGTVGHGYGRGDCVAEARFVWNGEDFVLSDRYQSGLCKGFPGGAWNMPIHTSEVVPATTD